MNVLRAVPRFACDRCGEEACVLDEDIPLCGPCFLAQALRRRRQANPLRFRRSRPAPHSPRLEMRAVN